MSDPQPFVDGLLGGRLPAAPDPSSASDAMEPGAYRFCVAVRLRDPSVHAVPTHARVRITPAFARWALQMRAIVERGTLSAVDEDDPRPTWLSSGSDDASGDEDDDRFLGGLAPARVHVSAAGVTWRTALASAAAVHLETEPLCFEELAELVMRAAAQSSSREGVPVHISQCIPASLTAPPSRAVSATRGLRAWLNRTHDLWRVRAEPRVPGSHKETER